VNKKNPGFDDKLCECGNNYHWHTMSDEPVSCPQCDCNGKCNS